MASTLRALFPLLLLTCGHGAVDSYVGLLQAVTPGAAEHLGLPIGELVMLVGLATLVNNMIQPLVGAIMGRRNLAWTLWVSVIVSSLPCLMGWVTGLWGLAFLVVIGCLGTGLYHPEAVLAASDAAGDKAYLGIPLFMAGGSAIYAVFTPTAIWISERWGFSSLTVLMVPGVIVGHLLLVEYRRKRVAHPSIVRRPRSRRDTIAQAGAISFWPLLLIGLCFCVANGLFLSVLASHFELSFGSDAREMAGWTLMAIGIGTATASFGWSWLARRYNFYGIAFLAMVAAVPLILLMGNPGSARAGLILGIILSFFMPASLHPVAVLLSRNAVGTTQAMRTAMMIGFNYGMSSLVIVLAGYLLRTGMDSQWLMVMVGGFGALAGLTAGWQYITTKRNGTRVHT